MIIDQVDANTQESKPVIPVYYHSHTDYGFFINMVKRAQPEYSRFPVEFKYASNVEYIDCNSSQPYVLIIPARNFTSERWGEDINPITTIPQFVVEDLNSSKAILIIDYSNESGSIEHLKIVERMCLKKNIHNHRNVIFLSQNRYLGGKAGDLTYFPADYFPFISSIYIKKLLTDIEEEKLDLAVRNFDKDKKILCLNATPREHRLVACSMLHYYQLLDNSLVSFPGLNYAKNVQMDLNSLILKIRKSRLSYLEDSIRDFIQICPLRVDDFSETGNALVNKVDVRAYQRTWISLVNETGVNKNVIRITEKTFKCMALGHPFVMFGNPNTFSHLKEYGFSIFSEVIDHKYDEIEDSYLRIEAIIKQIESFFSKIQTNENGCIEYIRDQAQFNRTWLRSNFTEHYCKKFITPIMEFILTSLSKNQG